MSFVGNGVSIGGWERKEHHAVHQDAWWSFNIISHNFPIPSKQLKYEGKYLTCESQRVATTILSQQCAKNQPFLIKNLPHANGNTL